MDKYLLAQNHIKLEVPQQFPLALFLVGGIALAQHQATSYYIAKRKEIFGRVKFMDNFKEDHEIGFGEQHKLHPHGDPDAVDGWYSRKLSYREWYQLACAKRAHQE
jgi:hypothetical protein